MVLGALIAAAAGFAGPLLLQDQRDSREDSREKIEARGAARILFAEFFQASTQMAVLANDRRLRRFDRSYRIEMRAEDLRLIASKLEGEQWGAVQDAQASVQGLETYVNTLIERGRTRLTSGEACYALYDLRSVRYAAAALADLADAPGDDSPPATPPNCVPKPLDRRP